LLARDGGAPDLVEMTSYHARDDGSVAVGKFLDAAACAETVVRLSSAEQSFKRRMLDCFASQGQVLSGFPLDVERFRPAPTYDFTRPPHAGALHYERHHWGV